MIPVLLTTYNRLEYTKQALKSLLNADNCAVTVIDNASTDGTAEWLKSLQNSKIKVIYNKENLGVSGAMNQFFELTKDDEWVGKVDNDTLVPPLWATKLMIHARDRGIDIIQAKHPIIRATHKGGWDGLMKGLKKIDQGTYQHICVGGSGILIRRSVIKEPLPKTDWILGGWFDWQLAHPEIKKTFYEGVEIKLLDEKGYGDYPEYYKNTGRIS